MPVYVDDMYAVEIGRYKRMKMSHMVADSQDELLAMVRTIGVDPRWIQKKGQPGEHFDIAKGKRQLAIDAGAIPITLRQCVAMCKRRRHEQTLGTPEEAEEWLHNYARSLKTA